MKKKFAQEQLAFALKQAERGTAGSGLFEAGKLTA